MNTNKQKQNKVPFALLILTLFFIQGTNLTSFTTQELTEEAINNVCDFKYSPLGKEK